MTLLHITVSDTETGHVASCVGWVCPSGHIVTVAHVFREAPIEKRRAVAVTFKGADGERPVAIGKPLIIRYEVDTALLPISPGDWKWLKDHVLVPSRARDGEVSILSPNGSLDGPAEMLGRELKITTSEGFSEVQKGFCGSPVILETTRKVIGHIHYHQVTNNWTAIPTDAYEDIHGGRRVARRLRPTVIDFILAKRHRSYFAVASSIGTLVFLLCAFALRSLGVAAPTTFVYLANVVLVVTALVVLSRVQRRSAASEHKNDHGLVPGERTKEILKPMYDEKNIPRVAINCVGELHKGWLYLSGSWIGLYLAMILRDCLPTKTDGVSAGFAVVTTLFNNTGTIALIAIYRVMQLMSSEEQLGKPNASFERAWLWMLSAVIVLAGLQSLGAFSGEPNDVMRLFSLASGMSAAVAMACCIGRLDSKFVDASSFLIALLYLYGAIQAVAWVLLEQPVDVLPTRWEQGTGITVAVAALVLKAIMLATIIALVGTERALFYFAELRTVGLTLSDRWERFDAVLAASAESIEQGGTANPTSPPPPDKPPNAAVAGMLATLVIAVIVVISTAIWRWTPIHDPKTVFRGAWEGTIDWNQEDFAKTLMTCQDVEYTYDPDDPPQSAGLLLFGPKDEGSLSAWRVRHKLSGTFSATSTGARLLIVAPGPPTVCQKFGSKGSQGFCVPMVTLEIMRQGCSAAKSQRSFRVFVEQLNESRMVGDMQLDEVQGGGWTTVGSVELTKCSSLTRTPGASPACDFL